MTLLEATVRDPQRTEGKIILVFDAVFYADSNGTTRNLFRQKLTELLSAQNGQKGRFLVFFCDFRDFEKKIKNQ